MNVTGLALLISIAGLAVYFPVHVLISRYFLPQRRWLVMKRLYFFFMPLALGTTYFCYRQLDFRIDSTLAWDFAACVLVILMLHVGYLTFYGFIDRSITLRAAVELFRNNNAPMRFDELVRRYDPKKAYLRRLEILQQSGFILKTAQGFVMTPKGRRTAILIRFLKKLYRVGPGG